MIENNKDFEGLRGRQSFGGVDILTGPVASTVVFICEYSTTVEASSQQYSVFEADVSGKTKGSGNLQDGFSMTLNGGSNAKFVLGERLTVEIKWIVTKLTNLYFFNEQCSVVHGNSNVHLIRDSCLSTKLKVSKKHETPTAVAFSYRTFNIVKENTDEQKIVCTIKICEKGQRLKL